MQLYGLASRTRSLLRRVGCSIQTGWTVPSLLGWVWALKPTLCSRTYGEFSPRTRSDFHYGSGVWWRSNYRSWLQNKLRVSSLLCVILLHIQSTVYVETHVRTCTCIYFRSQWLCYLTLYMYVHDCMFSGVFVSQHICVYTCTLWLVCVHVPPQMYVVRMYMIIYFSYTFVHVKISPSAHMWPIECLIN